MGGLKTVNGSGLAVGWQWGQAPSLQSEVCSPVKFLVSVTGHLWQKISDYMLVLCRKLHICAYDQQKFFLESGRPPSDTPGPPTKPSIQSGDARSAHADLNFLWSTPDFWVKKLSHVPFCFPTTNSLQYVLELQKVWQWFCTFFLSKHFTVCDIKCCSLVTTKLRHLLSPDVLNEHFLLF